MLTIILIHVQRGRAHSFRPRISSFSFMLFGIKREPQTRVGLVTSSLPRKRSTTELLRLVSFALSLFEYLFFSKRGLGSLLFPAFERKTGLEPATYSLEGYRSTKWATSACLSFGISWGRVDSNHRTLPRTDLQSVAIAAMRLPRYCCPTAQLFPSAGLEPMKGLEPPTGWLQISYSTNWVTSASVNLSNNSFSRRLRLQKYYFFHIPPKIFSNFFQNNLQLADNPHSKHTYFFHPTPCPTPQNHT